MVLEAWSTLSMEGSSYRTYASRARRIGAWKGRRDGHLCNRSWLCSRADGTAQKLPARERGTPRELERPEILVYAPTDGRGLKLAGVR